MQERLVDKFAFLKPIVQQENGAGEFMPTTVDLSRSVSTLTQSKAVSGPAVEHLNWMHVLSVASHALGSAQNQENRVLQSIPTTVIRSIPNYLKMKPRKRSLTEKYRIIAARARRKMI